jgi:CheY-specific phosphatase CheX
MTHRLNGLDFDKPSHQPEISNWQFSNWQYLIFCLGFKIDMAPPIDGTRCWSGDSQEGGLMTDLIL